MNAVQWVAVTATVDVGGIPYVATNNVHAAEYNTPDGRQRAHNGARCMVEDTIRENHPAMSIREAWDKAINATITTEPYTARYEEHPF